jgi:branched-chain amino acid transport system substrate-binding protein
MKHLRTKAAAVALAVAGAFGAVHEAAAQSNEIFVPVLVYRTGAYAPNGIPWADGYVDYLKLVNARDGGVNGVKIAFEECETGYATDRGVECYERLKSKKPVVVNPLSTGITYALTDKVANDKIVLFTTGYGRADSVDGSVFAWNFPLLGTYWSAADMLVQHVKKKGDLKGKKIALVYHDSPYGKEPIKLLEERAKREGFQLILLPVTHPGVEQKATWLQIASSAPTTCSCGDGAS